MRLTLALAILLGGLATSEARAELPKLTKNDITILKTPGGVRFGIIGAKPAAPAPTLFIFANDIANSLLSLDYNKAGQILKSDGFLSVALDVPGHGMDVRRGEGSNAISSWRTRIEDGEDLLAPLRKQTSEVIDYLVKEGYTDPDRVAAVGTSRGGFIATQLAASEPRIRAVVAFAPVTELMVVNEFKGTTKPDAVRALDLSLLADKLAGRSYWLCIGNKDDRVGTDQAIAFTRKLVASSFAAKKVMDVNVVIAPSIGHSIHKTAHDEAAAWLKERLKPAK